MRIVDYNLDYQIAWDELVDRSSQASFLFKRDYMEYHSDRFTDHSLLAFDDKNRLVAALPANSDEQTIISHGGLTYGGWITDPRHVDAASMLDLMAITRLHLAADGFKRLIYKPVPTIYHRYPAQDDLYALYCLGATIEATAISSTIDLNNPLTFNTNALRGAKHAAAAGVKILPEGDIAPFMALLTELLLDRYGVTPVHSLNELSTLMSRFPDNIRFHGAYYQGKLVAGVVMYLTPTVAHAQYIGASPLGKELKALPLLFQSLIDLYRPTHRYFDFGISTEDDGLYLNRGLQRQKSGMGGRGVIYTRMALDLV